MQPTPRMHPANRRAATDRRIAAIEGAQLHKEHMALYAARCRLEMAMSRVTGGLNFTNLVTDEMVAVSKETGRVEISAELQERARAQTHRRVPAREWPMREAILESVLDPTPENDLRKECEVAKWQAEMFRRMGLGTTRSEPVKVRQDTADGVFVLRVLACLFLGAGVLVLFAFLLGWLP